MSGPLCEYYFAVSPEKCTPVWRKTRFKSFHSEPLGSVSRQRTPQNVEYRGDRDRTDLLVSGRPPPPPEPQPPCDYSPNAFPLLSVNWDVRPTLRQFRPKRTMDMYIIYLQSPVEAFVFNIPAAFSLQLNPPLCVPGGGGAPSPTQRSSR